MEIRFLEVAQLEMDEAVDYYNTESPGLGNDFLLEVLKAVERIEAFPEAWHPFSKRTRRCRLRRFPYGIVYQILESEILILAIANLHREPHYWRNRIQNPISG